jgi:hypothetical protein
MAEDQVGSSGRLSPLALIRVKALDVFQMGNNHQVLAYGYDLNGNDLTIYIYDPNYPNRNNVTISLNIGDPQHTTPVRQSTGETLYAFFRPDYGFSPPPITSPTQFSNRLLEFYKAPNPSDWQPIDISARAGGIRMTGDPMAVFDAYSMHVYAGVQ